jgi:putative MATE family efflux protein
VLLVTTLINIGLDLLFVGPLHMEVAGAAWATVISQTLSALACLWRLKKMRETVELSRDTLRLRREYVKQVLRIGLPAGIMQAILSMSYVFVQSLINSIVVFDALGVANATIFVACNTAVTSVDKFANLPNQAFSMVGSTYAGQNIGAGQFDRVKNGFKIMVAVSLLSSLVLFAVVYVFGEGMLRWFIDMSEPNAAQVLALGVHVQRIMIWCYLIMAVMQPANGVLRGAGATMPVMWFTIIGTVFMRVPMAYIFVHFSKSPEQPGGSPDGIFWSMVICFSIVAAMCVIYYLSGRWKRNILVRQNEKSPV